MGCQYHGDVPTHCLGGLSCFYVVARIADCHLCPRERILLRFPEQAGSKYHPVSMYLIGMVISTDLASVSMGRAMESV